MATEFTRNQELTQDTLKRASTLGTSIECLDKGFVRLVDYMGNDLSVVRAARVSYDADWRTGEDDKSDMKLIAYLARNKHTSPFEAVSFTFEVKAPLFVFRQWHRHRTWSYNELSARYAELPDEFYIPDPAKIGVQSKSNKQVRDIDPDQPPRDLMERELETSFYQKHCLKSFELYHDLIKRAWPRELARMVLPLSTYSRMFATVDLHNLFHFLKLRLHPHAQLEIQEYAKAIVKLIEPVVPVSVAAWRESLV